MKRNNRNLISLKLSKEFLEFKIIKSAIFKVIPNLVIGSVLGEVKSKQFLDHDEFTDFRYLFLSKDLSSRFPVRMIMASSKWSGKPLR